LTDIDKILTSY